MSTINNVVPIPIGRCPSTEIAHLQQLLVCVDKIDLTLFNAEERAAVVAAALNILEHEHSPGEPLTSPDQTKRFLRLKIGALEHEVFFVIYLDSQHRILAMEELFRGSIDGASVYPREIVKCCLAHNAAAAIFAHNHPSGIPEPSDADIRITTRLKQALSMIDVRVLDHLIVGNPDVVSLASRGLL